MMPVMAFAVNVNSNYANDATLNVCGGNLESTYTAIRCYVWSGATTCILNIEGGYIEGGKRGVWAHAPESADGQTSSIEVSGVMIVGGTIDTANGDAIKLDDAYAVVNTELTGGPVDGRITANADELSVSGGLFTTDVSAYVDEDVVTATYTVEESGEELTVNVIGKELVNEVLAEVTEGTLTITNLPVGTTLAAPKEGLTVTNGTDEAIKVGDVTVEKDKEYEASKKEEPKQDPPKKEEPKKEEPKKDVPATGDMTDMMPWLAVMAVAAIGAVKFKKR